MQIRCYSCQTPFSLNRDAVHAALDIIEEEGLKYFNAPCPRCRKANRLSRQQLLKAAPDWVYTPAKEAAPDEAADKEAAGE
ncbi:MAG TPA: hypothetical protein VJ768_04965 [Anaerolineales bacterium]|nr:hypothetical protein [Anaerolineales bacterium]